MNRLNVDHSTEELRKLILENPDLPLIVVARDSEEEWTFCNKVAYAVGEILDCDYLDYGDHVFVDRDSLEEHVEEELYTNIQETSDGEVTDEDLAELVAKKLEELEPYWKKVIYIYGYN